MPKGKKYGGRKKGTPNKNSSVAREAFAAAFQMLAPEVVSWVKAEAAKGNEGRAAELTLRLAEYHITKPKEPLELNAGKATIVIDLGKD